MQKKHDLAKLYKLMRSIEANQNLKGKYVDLLNAKNSQDANKICDVENTMKASITNLLNETCHNTKDLSEFCQEIKMY